MKNHRLSVRALWLFGLCLPSFAMAQEEIGEEDVIVLDEIQAESVPIEESILPTTRPFVSLYGTELSIVDTPRNVTIISREQLDAISIRDPRDFSKLTSSAYTQSNFGAPSNPSIRGQTADVLVNGIRKGLTSNGNGLPTNFNAVESVNILKGPPSVSVGASQYVGGYVDLITKKPNFSEDSAEFTFTIDSEGLLVWEVDANYVVNEKLAFRTSYTAEDTDDYFYDDYKRKTHALYGAMVWKPTENYRLEVNGELFYADYTENWGWNRVTQDLIDDNEYRTGTIVGVTPTATSQSEALSDPATYATIGFGVGGPLSEGASTVELDRETRLLGEGDDSEGFNATAQAIQTFSPDSDSKIISNTFFQYIDRDTYSSYQYSEVLQDNWSFENRVEYQTDYEMGDILHSLNFGVSFRFQSVIALNDFFHEPANYWDLSRPASEIGVDDEFVFFDNPFTAFTSASVPIRGEESRGRLTLGRPASPGGNYGTFEINPALLPSSVSVNPGNLNGSGNPTVTYASNGDTNDSDMLQLGVFVQDNIELSDRWSWLIGGRIDYVHVETEDPLFDEIVDFLETFGVAGEADTLRSIGRASETIDEVTYNVNTSFVFKPNPNSSVYVTGNYAESPNLALGGGVSVDQAEDEEGFIRDSTLLELGYKAVFLDNTLFTNAAVYHQERTDPVQGGGAVETEATGFEFEMNYQPNRRFYATFGYSYIDAQSKDLGGAFIAEASTFDGTFNGVNLAIGDSESPGVPDHLFNFLTSYKLTDEFGLTLGAVVTSPINLTYANAEGLFGGSIESAEIPWQYSLDVGAFYETEKWSIRFKVLNVTDEENFGAVNPIYGNASVFLELPRRYEVSVSYKL